MTTSTEWLNNLDKKIKEEKEQRQYLGQKKKKNNIVSEEEIQILHNDHYFQEEIDNSKGSTKVLLG